MAERTLFDVAPEDARHPLIIPDDLTVIRELAEHKAWSIDNDHTYAAEQWLEKTYLHKLDMGDYSQQELDDYDAQIDSLFGAINDILKEADEQLMIERGQCFYGTSVDYVESLCYWYNITAPIHQRKTINYRDFKQAVLV